MLNLARKGVAEFLGVTLFVTAIIGTSGAELARLALATTLALGILLTASISGGHLNPWHERNRFDRKLGRHRR